MLLKEYLVNLVKPLINYLKVRRTCTLQRTTFKIYNFYAEFDNLKNAFRGTRPDLD